MKSYTLHELAGEINTKMPQLVVGKTAQALNLISQKALNGANILIIGMAYKKNVDDMRESPSLVLTELLEAEGHRWPIMTHLCRSFPVRGNMISLPDVKVLF